MRSVRLLALIGSFFALALVGCASSATAAASSAPVYIHMNGANDFLEPIVAVAPGQPVIFVNQDTGVHTVLGYDPNSGRLDPRIDGSLVGTPGAGHPVATYEVSFPTAGLYAYYCSVHATLTKSFGGTVQVSHRQGVDGPSWAMGGTIVVTTDPALWAQNPKSTAQKILTGFFGG